MTVRELHEAVLVEVNKESAQSFTVEEFNNVLQRTILAMTNKAYTFYAANQKLSDDLRALMKTHKYNVTDNSVTIRPIIPDILDEVFNSLSVYVTDTSDVVGGTGVIQVTSTRDLKDSDVIRFGRNSENYTIASLTADSITVSGADTSIFAGTAVLLEATKFSTKEEIANDRTVEVELSASDYFHALACKVTWRSRSPKTGEVVHVTFPAKRLTQDMHNAIETNAYLAPAAQRPYFKVFDNADNSGAVTNPINDGAQNKPVIEFHIGRAKSNMEIVRVEITYLKLPEKVELHDSDIYTYDQDNSQILEFPDYLRNTIVSACATSLIERERDARVQTYPVISQEGDDVPFNIQMDQLSRRPSYSSNSSRSRQ